MSVWKAIDTKLYSARFVFTLIAIVHVNATCAAEPKKGVTHEKS